MSCLTREASRVPKTGLVTACALCLATTPLLAQDARVQIATQKPPYYVGEPAAIQFTVDGFDEQPEPTCELETAKATPRLRAQMVATNPSVFSQIVQRNGQLYRTKRITYRIDYQVTADHPGDYTVGPFVIRQGKKEVRVRALSMSFDAVPADPNMRVRLILPDKSLYPDQRVPVTVEWWYAGDFEDILKLSIYSPLFDQFSFAPDPQPTRQSSVLPIDTKDGRLQLVARGRREEDEGRVFTVVSATRTLIPDRVGQFELAPINATMRKATEWAPERSLLDDFDDFGFGGSLFRDMMEDRRRPSGTALARAIGTPQSLVINPFPVANRPESFAGAVGAGFSIDVAADRTVVRVGDPIALNVTLRGDGNIENASLPPLSADGGLNPDLFKLPTGDVPGTMSEGTKRFRVLVRVSDESVDKIPALAYSWFNPDSETYQTTRSKPIALSVMPAKVISAGDVVRNPASSKSGTSDAAEQGGNSVAASESNEVALATRNPSIFSLSGADLAIEPDAGVVLRDAGRGNSGIATQPVLYGAGLLLVAVALLDRRRRNVDPALIARRKNVRRLKSRIAHAARLPKQEAAEEIATAMRALIAELPDVARDQAETVISECESIAYAPAGQGKPRLDEVLVERANDVASMFQQSAVSDQRSA